MKKKSKKCPFCGSVEINQISRTKKMKLLPQSKLYECAKCRGEFLSVVNMFNITLADKYPKSVLSE
jgi:hypothetical protein